MEFDRQSISLIVIMFFRFELSHLIYSSAELIAAMNLIRVQLDKGPPLILI